MMKIAIVGGAPGVASHPASGSRRRPGRPFDNIGGAIAPEELCALSEHCKRIAGCRFEGA